MRIFIGGAYQGFRDSGHLCISRKKLGREVCERVDEVLRGNSFRMLRGDIYLYVVPR